jgi:hypothetical protein
MVCGRSCCDYSGYPGSLDQLGQITRFPLAGSSLYTFKCRLWGREALLGTVISAVTDYSCASPCGSWIFYNLAPTCNHLQPFPTVTLTVSLLCGAGVLTQSFLWSQISSSGHYLLGGIPHLCSVCLKTGQCREFWLLKLETQIRAS